MTTLPVRVSVCDSFHHWYTPSFVCTSSACAVVSGGGAAADQVQVFSKECVSFMEDLTPWGLDVFALVSSALRSILCDCAHRLCVVISDSQDRLAGCRPLLALSSEILHRDGLLQRLKINPVFYFDF